MFHILQVTPLTFLLSCVIFLSADVFFPNTRMRLRCASFDIQTHTPSPPSKPNVSQIIFQSLTTQHRVCNEIHRRCRELETCDENLSWMHSSEQQCFLMISRPHTLIHADPGWHLMVRHLWWVQQLSPPCLMLIRGNKKKVTLSSPIFWELKRPTQHSSLIILDFNSNYSHILTCRKSIYACITCFMHIGACCNVSLVEFALTESAISDNK